MHSPLRLFHQLFLCLLFFVPLGRAGAQSVSNTVVIEQVYGGGGNTGATFRNDFIVLFNRGNTAVDLTNWSVQYACQTPGGPLGLVGSPPGLGCEISGSGARKNKSEICFFGNHVALHYLPEFG